MGWDRPTDRVFEALANAYRRRLLLALFDANPQADDDLDPLDLLEGAGTTDDPAAVRVKLAHVHLPKLADMGLIEWDRQSDELSKGPNWDEIAPLLQLIADNRDELPDEWLSEPSCDV